MRERQFIHRLSFSSENELSFTPPSNMIKQVLSATVVLGNSGENESPYLSPSRPRNPPHTTPDKDFHSPILAVTIVTQQINS